MSQKLSGIGNAELAKRIASWGYPVDAQTGLIRLTKYLRVRNAVDGPKVSIDQLRALSGAETIDDLRLWLENEFEPGSVSDAL